MPIETRENEKNNEENIKELTDLEKERDIKQDEIGNTEEDTLCKLTEKVNLLIEEQQSLERLFNEKIRVDRHREELFDKLHREVQDYRKGIVKQAILPLVRDLIKINDDILTLADNYRRLETPPKADELLKQMEAFTKDIDYALYRQGIDTYNNEEEKLDLRKQSILKTIKTKDKELERTVAERVKKGYLWDDQMIRKELVTVYVYDESLNEVKEND